ncbi:MAG: hypothetical protein ACTSV2_07535 [Candidatus Thorarchaeota archaeon]
MIILCISCLSFVAIDTSAIDNNSSLALASTSEGPTIEWPYTEEGNVMAWDGIYSGQTEQVWGHEAWVNDSDGVDCVIFRYQWTSQTEWINQSTTRIDGNDTTGLYSGNFTYDVWWDWEIGYPETEGDGANFKFKIFANDTLGNWKETVSMGYSGGYDMIHPPGDYVLHVTLINVAIIGAVIGGILVVIWAVRKYR